MQRFHLYGLTIAGAVIGSLGFANVGHAAVVSGSVSEGAVTSADLTSEGSLDWRLWHELSDNWSSPASIQNEKSGGSAIGDLTADFTQDDNQNRTFSQQTSHTYSYTDGVSPTNESNDGPYGAGIRGQIGDLENDSLSFTVTADSPLQHTLRVYGASRRAHLEVSAEINGVSDSSTFTPSDTSVAPWVYEVIFTPDAAGDQLTVTIGTTGDSVAGDSTFNWFAVGGASVSVIPEPASMSLLGLGGLAMLTRRRRQT